jgi:hypothetical protein
MVQLASSHRISLLSPSAWAFYAHTHNGTCVVPGEHPSFLTWHVKNRARNLFAFVFKISMDMVYVCRMHRSIEIVAERWSRGNRARASIGTRTYYLLLPCFASSLPCWSQSLSPEGVQRLVPFLINRAHFALLQSKHELEKYRGKRTSRSRSNTARPRRCRGTFASCCFGHCFLIASFVHQ